MPISNQRVSTHPFLRGLYDDGCYPDHVVDRGRAVLLALCERIERERPAGLAALYVLTQAATEEFNDLEAAFKAAGGEIETVAREEMAEDFAFVASAYGFPDADVEELIATAGVVRAGGGAHTAPPRPGAVPAGAETAGRRGPERQLRDARASFHVVDGRMAAAAFAGSGW